MVHEPGDAAGLGGVDDLFEVDPEEVAGPHALRLGLVLVSVFPDIRYLVPDHLAHVPRNTDQWNTKAD